jgi:hypothetical protein
MVEPVTFNASGGGTIVATQDPNTGQPTYVLKLPSGTVLGPISQSDFSSGNKGFSDSLSGRGGNVASLSLGNFTASDITVPADIDFLQGLYINNQNIAAQAQQDFQTQDTTASNTTAADTPTATAPAVAPVVETSTPANTTDPSVFLNAASAAGIANTPLPNNTTIIPAQSDPIVATGLNTDTVQNSTPEVVAVIAPTAITPVTAETIKTPPLTDAQILDIAPPVLPDVGTVAPSATGGSQGITGAKKSAQKSATQQDQANANAKNDWRVRLALAPGANYLYKAATEGTLLYPLNKTDGVIFPYTPTVSVAYAATYDAQSLTHSNYKVYQYQSSSVDSVTISGDFTCQDVFEANYLMAVIHFFRSATKMFYGQDSNPKNGTPPPLCYIYGLGAFQFDGLPLAITAFTYSLPADVDYIPTTGAAPAGVSQTSTPNRNNTSNSSLLSGSGRMIGLRVGAGGTPALPVYPTTTSSINQTTSWVPTKIQLSVTCVPVVSRNAVSNKFSLRDYATGNLLNRTNGGFW